MAALTWLRKSGVQIEEEEPEDEDRLVAAVSPAAGSARLLPAPATTDVTGGRRNLLSLISIGCGCCGGGGGVHGYLAGGADPGGR